jgi:hypothetical protein
MLAVYIFECGKVAMIVMVVRDDLDASARICRHTHNCIQLRKLGYLRGCFYTCSAAWQTWGKTYESLEEQVQLLAWDYIAAKRQDRIGTSTPCPASRSRVAPARRQRVPTKSI